MAQKEKKKIKGYTRNKTGIDSREGFKIKDPSNITYVKPYYRKKQK